MALGSKFSQPALLQHPPIPAPLHGVNPRTVLGAKWWSETRYLAYEQNNRHCWACARKRSRLEAHECYSVDYATGVAVFTNVVALCSTCHHFIHSNRLTKMVEIGVYNEGILNSVHAHGYHVLGKAGLEPSPWARLNFEPDFELPDELLYAPMAPWESWRMIIEGEEHPPRFTDRAAHDDYYNELNNRALEVKNR